MKIPAGIIPRIETEIKVGPALKIGNRILHFIVKVSILRTEEGILLGGWADPLAMVVSEQGEEYVFTFTEKDLTLDQLMEMAPYLREVLNRDIGVHRIGIT